MISEEQKQDILEDLTHYPNPQAVSIDALRRVQRDQGWVSDEDLEDLAAFLEMTPDELDAVATFYNLIYRRPVGRHVIHVCDSVSCWLMGYEQVRQALEEVLVVTMGETTAEGRFTLLPIPCLGTCDHAPALMVDEDLHQDVSPDGLGEILDQYQ
jgi:NADH-quinone oxidoreductase subunit E